MKIAHENRKISFFYCFLLYILFPLRIFLINVKRKSFRKIFNRILEDGRKQLHFLISIYSLIFDITIVYIQV